MSVKKTRRGVWWLYWLFAENGRMFMRGEMDRIEEDGEIHSDGCKKPTKGTVVISCIAVGHPVLRCW